jgi:hypothetical protein
MKYIKKFKLNESLGFCDFETFCDIMLEITDYVDHSYQDHSSSDGFYECNLYFRDLEDFYALNDDATFLEFLNVYGTIDDPSRLSGYYIDSIKEDLDSNLKKLIEFKSDLDKAINNRTKVKSIIDSLEKFIIPRFNEFSNFSELQIGFDVTSICLLFYLKS